MSKRFLTVSASTVLMVWVLASIARPAAAGDGWSLSSLNPFKKASTSKRVHSSVTDQVGRPAHSSWMSLPRPSLSNQPTKRHEPSTFEKMSNGTKAFFTKTKNVLMPWSKSAKKTSAHSSRAKKSFFSSWLPHKKKEDTGPKTVGDFLAQQRPGG